MLRLSAILSFVALDCFSAERGIREIWGQAHRASVESLSNGFAVSCASSQYSQLYDLCSTIARPILFAYQALLHLPPLFELITSLPISLSKR